MSSQQSKPPSPCLLPPPKQSLPPLCTLIFLLTLSILTFYTLHHPTQTTLTHFHNLFLSSSSNSTISSYLRRLTLHPHLAGTPPSLDTTNFVYSHFSNLGLETHKVEYKALLSYPVHASLSAYFSDGSSVAFKLTEENVKSSDGVVLPYHAYSPSGTVHDKVVYVNYGREEDYRALRVLGVHVKGCIVLAKKGGGLSRGNVVKIAESKGAIGVLIYAEGDRLRGGGVGLERGTVMRGIGDPLSPGWGSVDAGERLGFDDVEVSSRFPKIPSLPLSFDNADVILRSLGGPLMPLEWLDVEVNGGSRVFRVGPGPTVVNFTYKGEKKIAGIQNVFAVIRGLQEPDRFVILGNHRDAWTYGAVDPNSGTAALLDIARRYTLLMKRGWNPRRTIILGSWDAEEFGMVGSTEWVEQNLLNLGAKAVAYLNVDCAVQGPGFFARATPQLDNLLLDVTKKVKDPDLEGATIYENWVSTSKDIDIQRLSGVDSDFAPFLQHAGIPSVDLFYGSDFPVYHSAFDTYEWMIHFADPYFHRHVAVAGIWGLLALRLADDSALPYSYLSYAAQLKVYTDILKGHLDQTLYVDPLMKSINEFASAAKQIENESKLLQEEERRGDAVDLKLRELNDRLMLAERGFLDEDGLPGRRWFKHLIYGPTSNLGSKLEFFPGIVDTAMSEARSTSGRDRQAANLQHEIWRVARAIERVAKALKGGLI